MHGHTRLFHRLAALAMLFGGAPSLAQEAADLSQVVASLVEQLNADEAADRDAAEKQLIQQATSGAVEQGEALLAALPKPNDRMPQEVQVRLARIEREIRQRLASRSTEGTRVTLDVTDAPLAEVIATLQQQTGNRLVDNREQFGQEPAPKKVTVKAANEPFWSALDKVLVLSRTGRAVYSGAFRIEATSVTAQRGLRSPDESSLRLELEIAWEPRLRPIALTQAAADLKATVDDGRNVPATSPDAVFDVEVEPGTHAAEVTLPLQLPGRDSQRLQSVEGTLTALVPGRIVELTFDKLAEAREVSQQTGGVSVTLDRVVQNQALWEVHMRIRIDSMAGGIESHRGWVFQNVSFLRDDAGEQLDHAGYETTLQTEKEAGFAYFFELPEGRGIGDYQWVY
ncbi:MAG: hypothetical protein DCC67_21025, partial [Planctomycetota bacterium]